MNFDEIDTLRIAQQRIEIHRFEGHSGANKTGTAGTHWPLPQGRFKGVSEPGPDGVSISVQVPVGTSFQASPW
jgi:hypothetical protein